MRERTPYKAIDPPVRNLIRVLNRFPGIHTYTSCGGHRKPENRCQPSEGCWYVDLHVDRTDEGHASLEFFAWVNYSAQTGAGPFGVVLDPFADPPHVNRPGGMLFYRWAGHDPDDPESTADSFAKLLTDLRRRFYVTALQGSRYPPPEEWGC